MTQTPAVVKRNICLHLPGENAENCIGRIELNDYVIELFMQLFSWRGICFITTDILNELQMQCEKKREIYLSTGCSRLVGFT